MMDQRVDRGSIQSISNYIRAGEEAGYDIALYGLPRSERFQRSVSPGISERSIMSYFLWNRGGTG